MTVRRMEELETPVSVATLIDIANEWDVPLHELYVEESYEMGGSGMVWVQHGK